MEAMNVTTGNSHSPQHPVPEHVPWQGNRWEGLEKGNWERSALGVPIAGLGKERVCSERVGEQQRIPSTSLWAAKDWGCWQQGFATSLGQGIAAVSTRFPNLPRGANSRTLRSGSCTPIIDPSLCLTDGEGKSSFS